MENKQLQNKIRNAAKWSSITEIIAKIITPITNMILARLLVPEAFGIVATVMMIISFTTMFSDAGFQKYLVQKEFENEKEKNQSANVAFWTNLAISLLLWIIIIIFRDPLAIVVGNPGLGNVLAIASIQLPLTSFFSIQMALYKRSFDFKTLFIARLVGSLIPLFITIPLALAGLSYWALIIGSICDALSNAIILVIKSKWKPTLFYSFSILKEMFSYSFWTLLESISIWLTLWVDVLIIGNAFNEYYLGLYKNSVNMVNSLMVIVSASILPVLFSALSRIQNNEVMYKKMYYTTQRFVSYIVFPMGLGVFIYSELATQIMFGSKWLVASGIVGIWSLMVSFRIVFSNFNGEVYRSMGKPKVAFFYQIIHLFFLIPACLIALGYGFWPFVYTRALMELQGTLTGFIFMRLIMGFSIKAMIGNIVKPITSSVLMGLVAISLQQVSNSLSWSFFSIIICIIAYGIILFLIAKDDFKQIIGIITNRKIAPFTKKYQPK